MLVAAGEVLGVTHWMVPESLHHFCQDVEGVCHLPHNQETPVPQTEEGTTFSLSQSVRLWKKFVVIFSYWKNFYRVTWLCVFCCADEDFSSRWVHGDPGHVHGGGGRDCLDHRDIPAPDSLHSRACPGQGISSLSKCELRERERERKREKEREKRGEKERLYLDRVELAYSV